MLLKIEDRKKSASVEIESVQQGYESMPNKKNLLKKAGMKGQVKNTGATNIRLTFGASKIVQMK